MNLTITNFTKVSTNKVYAGVHWATRKQWANDWHSVVMDEAIRQYGNKIPTFESKLVRVEIAFSWQKNPLDASNCSFMGKCIEDSLVLLGVIQDDGVKFVRSVKYDSMYDKSTPDICTIQVQYLQYP
jgi:hypothetical protein